MAVWEYCEASAKYIFGDMTGNPLVEQIRTLDEASTVSLVAPAQVQAGQVFPVTVQVTGGAGPVVGIGLVDRAHRW